MHVRRLTPQDTASYRSLRLSALREAPTAFGSSHEEEAAVPLQTMADRLTAHPDQGAFGAFDGDRLFGMVTLRREDKRKLRHKGMIYGLYVAPEGRGRGMGRALLSQALVLAGSVSELLQVNLSVNAGNVAAIALYESLGFQTFGREPGALRIDGVLHDELHMFWRPAR